MHYKIESDALALIATQQPMAADMRMIAAALIIANELERIDDYAKGEVLTLLFSNVKQIRQGNLLVMAAHNLERAADRATNICERVIYCVTGKLLDTGWENDVP
jgi:phosphate uptake regulator